jgi:basic membrane protein A
MQKFFRLIAILAVLTVLSCNPDSEVFDPDFEVYAVLPAEGLGDRSFVDVLYEGIEVAKTQFNFRVRYIIPDSLEAGREWISGIPRLTPGAGTRILVIVGGNQYAEAVDKLHGNFGNCNILLLAGSASECEGLASVTYRTFAPSYIGGFLSAGLVPECRAVVVEAFDAPFLREFRAGFEKGVADAGGTVHEPAFIADGFEGFSMSDSAYTLTNSLLPDNDLVYALADGSNFGIINAARDYPDKRFVIGIDSDQSWMGLSVVPGSVVILYGLEIQEYVSEFSKSTFSSGHFIRSMEDGKTAFRINNLVLGNIILQDSLLQTAIRKENAYHKETP